MTHFQILKLVNYPILFLILFLLWGLGGYAQTFNWDWAVSGGGAAGDTRDEQIYDVKVGTDNNYYFIAPLYGGSGHQLDGQSLPTYNVSGVVARDILLFSTTCDGTIRWSHVLGGGSTDQAYNLVLDSQNNVYIGINMGLGSTTHQKPVYFSPTDSLPLTPAIEPSDYYKTTFLVKFGSTGQYLGKKALQGDVGSYYPSPSNFSSSISDLAISNDTLHFIVGLQFGNHLDGNVTVPSQYNFDGLNNPALGHNSQYHLAKYDTNLNYVSSMVLPIADYNGFRPETTRFIYDQNLDQYYLAGMRSMNVTAALIPLTYGGRAFVERNFVLAIDGTNGNELWRRESYAIPAPGDTSGAATSNLTSLSVDTNSDVYVTLMINRTYNDSTLKIYDPHDSINTTYPITLPLSVHTNVPMVVKFSSNSTVQWIKAPSDFANGKQSNNAPAPKGLAINGNEVAFGSSEGSFEWNGLYHPVAQFHRPDPALLRLDKQTGNVIGLHGIPAGGDYDASTAVAVDKDGNYIVGGFFMEVHYFLTHKALHRFTVPVNPIFSSPNWQTAPVVRV